MSQEPRPQEPRPPSLLDALLPVFVLIALLALTIVLFGVDAANGPLQVALLLAAAFASLIALKNGHTIVQIREAAVSGVSSAMGAIFILLAVGALIGTWNMAGTIPSVVHLGIGILSANWFFVAAALVCAVVGMITGSSWTTAGTLGVAFVGMAKVIGVSPEIAAGAVISGAYFGDKMTPLSETTILVPQLVGGLTVMEHVKHMLWTALPALGVSLIIFAVLGLTGDVSGAVDKKTAQDAIESVFNISFWNLLPLFLMVFLTFKQVPPFLALMGCALLAGLMAPITQWNAVEAFAGGPGQSAVATSVKAIYGAMANGFVSDSGIDPIDSLFSRGDGKHADHRLAHTRGALVRCDSRARRLPRPPIEADRVVGAFDGHADQLRRGGRDRLERDRGRSVRGRRAAGPHVPQGIPAEGAGPSEPLRRGRERRNCHVRPHPMEQLRSLHRGRTGGFDHLVPAVLLLQHT